MLSSRRIAWRRFRCRLESMWELSVGQTLVNATVGFEELAAATRKPAKSLHRMLSHQGNPTMDNLAAILNVIRRKLRVDLQTRTIKAA
jgi:DNA-binding phage protein